MISMAHNPSWMEQMMYSNRRTSLCQIMRYTTPTTEGMDSISYGLIYAFLAPYLILLGADNLIIGLVTVFNLVGELLSEDVARIFGCIRGKRTSLFLMFVTAGASHVLLVSSDSYWYTVLARFMFCITNHSQNIIQELLMARGRKNDKYKESTVFNFSILGGLGYLIGPILAGFMFDEYGFYYVAMLAAGLTGFNILLLLILPRASGPENFDQDEYPSRSVLRKSIDRVSNFSDNMWRAGVRQNWDLVFVKYLFASSIIVFYTKYAQIMKHNYEATSFMIGLVTAYLNLLIFLSTFYFPTLNKKCGMYCKMRVMRVTFLIFGVTVLGACMCPYFVPFLFLCLVLTFLRTFINAIWKETARDRRNLALLQINNPISVFAGLSVPIVFGVVNNEISHHAVTIFSAAPMPICWFILFICGKSVPNEEAVSSSSSSESD